MEVKRYKCYKCSLIINTPECPECHTTDMVKPMCKIDHCHCGHDVVATIAYCPECGEAMCPICGCHDVVQVSRVTGYLQDVAGWNAAKAQELKDRTRYTI